MGAGGVDGSRRSFYVGHVKKGYESYRKGAQNPKPNHGDRHGSPGLKRYSKSLHGRQMNPFHDDVRDRQCLAPERFELEKDYEVQLPPQKKRKISPIVGNGECKFVGATFQIKAKTVGFTASPLSSEDEMSNLVDDGVMAEKSLDVQADSENFGFPQFAELNVHPNPDSRQIEEEGSIQSPNIATSRWASDLLDSDKSTSSDGEGIYKTSRWTKNLSTPESGECLMNDYEGQRASSNCFNISDNELESVILTNFDNAQADHSDVREQEEKEAIVSVQDGLSMLLGSRSVDEYEKLKKISEGSYGVVYRARDRITGEVVALKKVKMNLGSKDEFGFPLTSLREIGILLSCNHPSIVNVKEVVVGNLDSVFMVLEHLEHDLKNVMDHLKYPFSTSEVKCLMMQLLEGLKYLHDNWIIHRDLKPANLLYSNKGELKICDFGMARLYGNLPRHYTQLVVTQWYRAPELLLGAKQYSTSIDMWSVGCIMAELLTSKPLFQGKCGSDIDQLHKIFGVLGTPDEKIWPGFSALPGSKAVFVKQPCNMLRKKFPAASFTGSLVLSDLGLDLLNKLLTRDPEKRITVDAALNHDWFLEVPLPKSKEFMPTFPPRRD